MRFAVPVVAVVITLALGSTPMRADDASQYVRDGRVGYIGSALSAIDTLGPKGLDVLYLEVLEGSRGECRSDFAEPTISCLLDMSNKLCEGKPTDQQANCFVMADVIVTNMLSEREFVSDADRLAIMNKGENFRGLMRAELRLRCAPLVAGLALSPGFGAGEGLAPAIDEFCEDYSSTRYLVWQRCVAGILWYIGTEESDGTQ